MLCEILMFILKTFPLQKIRMLGGEVTDDIVKCSHLISIDGKR